jgi:hypothetical protein
MAADSVGWREFPGACADKLTMDNDLEELLRVRLDVCVGGGEASGAGTSDGLEAPF